LQGGYLRIKASPPSKHHDLIDAAANVGILETRLGYTFKNRMTCLNALKISTYPLYYDGTVYTIGGNRRLALLGDRVLSLVLCEIWFQTEHSNREYGLMSSETVSRAALAITGRAIGLNQSMLVPNDNKSSRLKNWKDHIAEAFEAVLGAVYVDSNYDIKAVKAIISKLRLDDHQFLKTHAKVDIAQITTVLPQSVDEQAVMSASPTSTAVNDVQDSTTTEKQKPNKLNQREKPGFSMLNKLAKSTCAETAESATKPLEVCDERAKAGLSSHPQLDFVRYRQRINQRKARAEHQAERLVRNTEENNVASEGVQQEARKTTATKAHKMVDEQDSEIGEDSSEALTDLRKQDNDKPKGNTEPRKAQIQQLARPAIEDAQGATQALQKVPKEMHKQETQRLAKTKTRKKMDSNKNTQLAAQEQNRARDIQEEIALGSLVGKVFESASASTELCTANASSARSKKKENNNNNNDAEPLEQAVLESQSVAWHDLSPEAPSDLDPKSGRSTGTRDRNEDLVRPTKKVARKTQIEEAKKDFAELLGSIMQDNDLEVTTVPTNGELSKDHDRSNVRNASNSREAMIELAFSDIRNPLVANTIETVYISALLKSRNSPVIDSGQKPIKTASRSPTLDEDSGYSSVVLKHMTQVKSSWRHQMVLDKIIRFALREGIRFNSTTWDDMVQRVFEHMDKTLDFQKCGENKVRNLFSNMLKAQTILPVP
jgi:dsRNA-specific ribonuclease